MALYSASVAVRREASKPSGVRVFLGLSRISSPYSTTLEEPSIRERYEHEATVWTAGSGVRRGSEPCCLCHERKRGNHAAAHSAHRRGAHRLCERNALRLHDAGWHRDRRIAGDREESVREARREKGRCGADRMGRADSGPEGRPLRRDRGGHVHHARALQAGRFRRSAISDSRHAADDEGQPEEPAQLRRCREATGHETCCDGRDGRTRLCTSGGHQG